MPFSDSDRSRITRTAAEKYVSYWHAMHPVTFSPKALYRTAWPDDAWEAVKLLMKKHSDAVTICNHFNYQADFSGYKNKPDWIPSNPTLTFHRKKLMPYMDVMEDHVGPKMAMEMRRWILKAYHFRNQKQFLHSRLTSLVKRRYSYSGNGGRAVKLAQANTPRILHGIWPEVTPFMSCYLRNEVRGNRNKVYPIPRNWTKEMAEEFRSAEGMEELNNVLLAVGLIDDCTDEKYPEFSG